MAIKERGFFSVPDLLLHGPSVYNGHLRGPVALTQIAERLALFIQERFRRRFGHLRKKSDDLDNENVEEKRGI